MELYLIRHADAIPLGENGITEDEQRPLTPKGEQQADAMGKLFKARGIGFDRIISSPLVRARQTAEIMLESSGIELDLAFSDTLVPEACPKKLGRYLKKMGGERVAVVGHLPHMGEFASWIIGSRKANIDVAKAGVALVSIDDAPRKGRGSLQWLITPDWF